MVQNYRENIKQNKNRGAAMIMVLCIMAVFLMLCGVILLGTATAVNTVRQNVSAEKCRIEAVTFCSIIDDAMLNADSSMQSYIRNEIQSGEWKAYNGEQETVRDFSIEGTASPARMEIYWEQEDDVISLYVTVNMEKDKVKFSLRSEYEAEIHENGWRWKLVERK